MPSLINNVFTMAAFVALATGSAIPKELEKRDLPTCPSLDGTKTNGGRFTIRCDTDTISNGGREKMVQASDFADCMVRCENSVNGNWCNFVAFPGQVNEPGPCYMKHGNGGGYVKVSGTKLGIRK